MSARRRVAVPDSREQAWARAVTALTEYADAGHSALTVDVALGLLSLDPAIHGKAVAMVMRASAQDRRADPVTGCLPVTAAPPS